MINNNTIPNVIQNLTNQESEMDEVIKNYLTPASIILFFYFIMHISIFLQKPKSTPSSKFTKTTTTITANYDYWG